jgi:cation diffusion facilitator family transporter
MLPLIVMALSVAIKTFLFLLEYYVGKKEHSKAMLSEAMNMRNDILMSTLVFVGIWLNKIGFAILDPILGILLSLFIIKTAFEIFRDSVYELMEGLPPEELEIYEHIKDAISQCQQVKDIMRIRVRKMGRWYIVDIDLKMDGNLTLYEIYAIKQKIQGFVKEKEPHIREINIVVYPSDVKNVDVVCNTDTMNIGEKGEEKITKRL